MVEANSPSSEEQKTEKKTTVILEETPFGEPVMQRDYADQGGPIQLPTEEQVKKQATSTEGVVVDDLVVEDDPQGEVYKKMEAQAKQESENPFGVEDKPMTFSDPEEVPGSYAAQVGGSIQAEGQGALSEMIYTNLSHFVPTALSEFSKIKEKKFTDTDWNSEVVDLALERIREHNVRQQRKFSWGEPHEINIRRPLKAFLIEQGLEDAVSPGGRLLIGIGFIIMITYMTFMEVKRENQSMEKRLLRDIEKVMQKYKPAVTVSSNGKAKE